MNKNLRQFKNLRLFLIFAPHLPGSPEKIPRTSETRIVKDKNSPYQNGRHTILAAISTYHLSLFTALYA